MLRFMRLPSRSGSTSPAAATNSTAIVLASPLALTRRGSTSTRSVKLDVTVPASPNTWTSVAQAAAYLGISDVTLRRALDRCARRDEAGGIVAERDGVVARKFGRTWRVWLDAGWVRPGSRR
jgi:hypothetical protein